MNFHINLSGLNDSTNEEELSPNVPLPFIPLSALSEGLILYDFKYKSRNEEISSEGSWDNNPPNIKSQELLNPCFDYRTPEKLLENHSVIKNSILIDFEKRVLRKTSILGMNQKRVSFRESPRDSSSHKRSKSESKNLVSFKLELIIHEEPCGLETIDDEVT